MRKFVYKVVEIDAGFIMSWQDDLALPPLLQSERLISARAAFHLLSIPQYVLGLVPKVGGTGLQS